MIKKFVFLSFCLWVGNALCATITATKTVTEDKGTYTFYISYENDSNGGTATNVIIIDAIPLWFEYVTGSAGTQTQAATITYSSNGGESYFNFETPPITNIKWELKNDLGPEKYGTATFRARRRGY